MAARSEQLQIRLTRAEKIALKRRAHAAGLDLSAYVLARALPPEADRLAAIVATLRDDANRRFALAALNDSLSSLTPIEFSDAVARIDVRALSLLLQNYVAAMVEHAAHSKGVSAPRWTDAVVPLGEPFFATQLKSLRLHLLRVAPVAFRRRNIFADSTVGARV
jgi:mobilization protein NikA